MTQATDFRPLGGLRVVELSDGLSGSYCAKLFADAGAEVVRVEDGEPQGGEPQGGALSGHLHEGKEIVRLDVAGGSAATTAGALDERCRRADLVVSQGPLASRVGLEQAIARRRESDGGLSVVSISAFGASGPLGGQDANEFLLQARVGSIFSHGLPDRTPIMVGGRLGEWATGAFAAAGALAACLDAERTGLGSTLDLSMLECLALSLVTYPTVAASFPGGFHSRGVGTMIPAVEPCADGYVGLFTVTAEQFAAFLTMIERPDLAADTELATYQGRIPRMAELVEATHAWTTARRADEVIEQAVMFRVPAAPVGNGRTLPELAQAKARGIFVRNAAGILRPRTPFRWHRPEETAASAAGNSSAPAPASASGTASASASGTGGPDDFLPLTGISVLDLTAFWAGPFASMFLGSMGAEVLKIESVQRPDPMRFNTRTPASDPTWYEQGYLFHGANLGKRGLTLALRQPAGRELALRLLRTCDVVMENFTPRVLEQFDLGFDVLRRANPEVVCVRMPAFGLDGPWRDRPGFAPNVEQASGMAWVTGYPDGPPMVPGGSCDPIAGMYAAFAVMGALRHRRRVPGAQMVELPMIEIGAALTAEQVIEWDTSGHLVERSANREPEAAPQGVYECRGEEAWVAVSVCTDGQWRALAGLLGGGIGADTGLATAAGRQARHDELDALLTRWCGGRPTEQAARELEAAGVPCAPVVPHYDIDGDPQMLARRFWEPVDHPVVGTHLFPSWPFRVDRRRTPWHRAPAPLLGHDTERVLSERLGLGQDELARLRADEVIGTIPSGM